MATYIKICNGDCQEELSCECDGCGSIQHALGLDDSVTSISVQNGDCDIGVINFWEYDTCGGFGYSCGDVQINSAKSGNECGIFVGWYSSFCDGGEFYAGPISLPFTTSNIPIYCFGEFAFTVSITLS